MNNACFVIDRSQLKNSDDWLVTDLGSFENRGSSARIYVIQNDKIVKSWACKLKVLKLNGINLGVVSFSCETSSSAIGSTQTSCEIQLSSIVVAVKHSHWG